MLNKLIKRIEKQWFNRQIIFHYNEDSIAELEQEVKELREELDKDEISLRKEIKDLKYKINNILYTNLEMTKSMWKEYNQCGHLSDTTY